MIVTLSGRVGIFASAPLQAAPRAGVLFEAGNMI
jgi:hypothetical protein